MTTFLVLLAELIGLYLLASLATKKLYTFFLLVTGSRTVSVTLMTLLLFPGTVIHELSHLFTAEVLGVRTGKLTLVPENIREEEIQTGSVAVSQTDPFRRAVVGLAPFLVGLGALITLVFFLTPLQLSIKSYQLTIKDFLLFYLIFTIGSSMFPSGQDLKGTPALIFTLTLFVLAGYIMGLRIGLTGQALETSLSIFSGLTQSLGLVLAVDIAILLIMQVLIALAGKILHRKVELRP